MKWQILRNIKYPFGPSSGRGQISNIKTKSDLVKTDEITKVLLANRGLKTKKEIEEFLNPKLENVTNRNLGIKKKEVKKAVSEIKKAIKNKDSIVVYGDFDADGVSGTAILWETLNMEGARVMPYIPHRVQEGYGLSKKGIDNILTDSRYKTGTDQFLIITVDHGITAAANVDYAKKKGIKVIITDHHVPPKRLPRATAIVHTTELSGAGVAWILAQAIIYAKFPNSGNWTHLRQIPQFRELDSNSLELVAIGTIADMVSLIGANRTLVKYGLEALNKTERVGLKALITEVGIKQGEIGPYEVSFILAPRLNAMGRLVHAMDSLRLLCTKDPDKARELAQKLGRTNRERQLLMEETVTHAKNNLTMKQYNKEETKLIFLSHESYNQGVIGLVAGKLVEEFYRPAVVVSRGEIISKASCRSINGFNIIEAIRKTQGLLVDCGGHPMAAGFTVETKYLEMVEKSLKALAKKELNQEKLTKVLKVDCEIDINDVTWDLYQKIQQFMPFGLGNPEPVFMSKNVTVRDARLVGADGKHLKLSLSCRPTTNDQRLTTFSAIGFKMGEWFSRLSPDKPIDLAYTIFADNWSGEKKLELKIKDIARAAPA